MHDGIVKQVYDAACRLRARPHRPAAAPVEALPRRPGGPAAGRGGAAQDRRRRATRVDATGYALLRRKPHWDEHGPEGTVNVVDLHAVDTPSAYALWRRVLDLDLMAEVKTPGLPLDHPLTIWASEVGARSEPGHTLWTRVIDVASSTDHPGLRQAISRSCSRSLTSCAPGTPVDGSWRRVLTAPPANAPPRMRTWPWTFATSARSTSVVRRGAPWPPQASWTS